MRHERQCNSVLDWSWAGLYLIPESRIRKSCYECRRAIFYDVCMTFILMFGPLSHEPMHRPKRDKNIKHEQF